MSPWHGAAHHEEMDKHMVQPGDDGQSDDPQVTVLPVPLDGLAELDLARRLVAEHGPEIRWAPELGHWLTWDGTRWAPDATGDVHRRAVQTVDRIRPHGPDRDVRRALDRMRSESTLRAIVRLAALEPGMAVRAHQLDAHPYLLATANGTVDLRTGRFRRSDPADLITRRTQIDFDPNAKCPRWDQFLGEALGSTELIEFLQRLAGMSLTADVSEQIVIVLWGDGGNGKTTLLNALGHVAGDHAVTLDSQLLLAGRSDHPTTLMDLRGARLAVTSEPEVDRRLAEALVKWVTGGESITARRMRCDPVTFPPTHTLWLAANHLPEVAGTEHAIWRRLLVIPFGERVLSPDRLLPEKLRAEAPGILAWAVRGAVEWQRDRLRIPEVVWRASDAWRQRDDHVAQFVRAECVLDPELTVTVTDLRAAYERWCAAEGERPRSQRSMASDLRRLGARPTRTAQVRSWAGIGLRRSGLIIP